MHSGKSRSRSELTLLILLFILIFLSLFILLPNFRVGEWTGGVFGRGGLAGIFYFLLPALFLDIAVNHLSVKAGM